MSTTSAPSQTNTNRVYAQVQAAGSTGITVDQVVASLGLPRGTVAGRMSELKRQGKVEILTGKTAKTRANKQAVLYVVSTSGTRVAKQSRKSGGTKSKAGFTLVDPIPTTLKNHFILVTDHSGSMSIHRKGAARLFNKQVETILAAHGTKTPAGVMENTITSFQFGLLGHGPQSIQETRFNVPPSMAGRFADDGSDYQAMGNTPLYDAVIKAGQRALCDSVGPSVGQGADPGRSYVVFVLTDGEENESRTTAIQLREFITKQQATDHWTFAFLVPHGYKQKFVTLSGVHEANVQEWEDIATAEQAATAGTQGYFGTRASGGTSTASYFQTNLGHVDGAALAKLREVTGEVKSWSVEKEMDILTAINYRTGGKFAPGKSYYELTKKEKVQDYKRLLIMDRQTGKIYADGVSGTIRDLLGLPNKGDITLEPGNMALMSLYVQSTSVNRKLVRGSRVVFWDNAP